MSLGLLVMSPPRSSYLARSLPVSQNIINCVYPVKLSYLQPEMVSFKAARIRL